MSAAGGPGDRYRVCTRAHAVDLDGEVLIWDAGAQELHRLNPTATRIWHELSSWRTSAEVAETLCVGGALDATRVERDVAQCVERLTSAGLLEVESAR